MADKNDNGMKNPKVTIQNGYRYNASYGTGNTKPMIKVIDTNEPDPEEFRIEVDEIEKIIENTILKGRFKIEKRPRKKYKRIALTN